MSAVRVVMLKNGFFASVSIIEIVAIPSKETTNKTETQLFCAEILNDISQRSYKQNIALELVFSSITDSSNKDKNDVRAFIILRKYTGSKLSAEKELEKASSNIISILSSNSYKCSLVDTKSEDFLQIVSCYSKKSIVSFSRRPEIEPISEKMGNGCYYTKFERTHPLDFFSLFESLQKNKNTIVSFFFIPTNFTEQEGYIINEICSHFLGMMKNDFMFPNAQKVRKYYEDLRESSSLPMFLTGISVIGSAYSCEETAKVCLQTIRHSCPNIKLSPHKATLNIFDVPSFVFYPWNQMTGELRSYQKTMNFDTTYCRFPFILSEKEALSLFQLPFDDGHIRGIEINHDTRVREKIANKYFNSSNIIIGSLGDNRENNVFGIPAEDFSRHALIVGMPGTGKTTFSINVLLQMYKKGIPFLAIEPTKTEYRAMIDAIPDLNIFTPGNSMVVPYVLNPFIPPKGISLELFKPSLFSAFKVAFSMPSPLDILFNKAIDECYTKYGWRNYSKVDDPGVTHFGLEEFIIVFKKIIDESSYSNESKNNMRSAGVFRLMNLIVQGGNVYDNINCIPISDILSKPTVIELNSIESYEQKSLFMALLLIQIVLYTKHIQKGDGHLKNIILIDEAHVLLGGGSASVQEGNPDAGKSAVQTLQNMIAEIRSYGTGIIISDQSPQKVTKEIVGNTDIKVVFQLVESQDKEMISKAINMEEIGNTISRLRTGEAYVFCRGLAEPLKVTTEDIRKKENIRLSVSNEEICSKNHYWDNNSKMLIPYMECSLHPLCQLCNQKIREDSKFYSNKYFNEVKSTISDKKSLFVSLCNIGAWLKEQKDNTLNMDKPILFNCIRVHLVRLIMLELDIDFDEIFIKNTLDSCHNEVDKKLGYY